MLISSRTAAVLFPLSPFGGFEDLKRASVLPRDELVVDLELLLFLVWESQLLNFALASLPLLVQLLKLGQRVIICGSRRTFFQLADLQFSQSLVFIEDFRLIVQPDREL